MNPAFWLPLTTVVSFTQPSYVASTLLPDGFVSLLKSDLFPLPTYSRSHSICVFIATFMHYFFLVAAFWMNVMSFDVARAFASSAGIVEAGHKDVAAKRRFKYYMAYAWGIPVLIGESNAL